EDWAGERSRRVPRRERRARRVHEGVHAPYHLERPRPVDELLQAERDEIGRPDRRSRAGQEEERASPRPRREGRREDDPHETCVAEDGEPDEDRVQPAGAVVDDPEERVALGLDGGTTPGAAASSTRSAAVGRRAWR